MTDPPVTGRSRARRLRSRLALLLGAVAAVLVVCLLVITLSLVQLSESRRAVIDRIDPAALAARDLRTSVLDQETGVRGYALTGDRTFLDPYTAGVEAELRHEARLRELVAPDHEVAQALEAVIAEVSAWRRDSAAPTIAGVDRGDPTVSAEDVLASAKVRFDGVRRSFDRLDAALLAERQSRADDLFANSGQVAAAVAVLAGATLVVGFLLFVALRRWVTDPVERLGRDVREIAGGDLHHEVRGEASVELEDLATDIDAMRNRILDELAKLKEATAEVERQAADLARSNADLEQFAYVASHDLQEPLRKVAGFCQLLQRRYGGSLDERADEYIRYAVDGAQRMQQLINDLLAFSRVGRTTERFEPVRLDAVARRAIENLSVTIEGSEAEIAVDDDLPTVPGDPRLLGALFQNLIANGIKFRRPDVTPRVTVHATETASGEVEVTVADNGIGIDEQYGEQIFTLFGRLHTKSEYEGTGIGLALCKRIVEFHGGHIELAPPDGTGATFRFTLPLTQHQEPTNGRH